MFNACTAAFLALQMMTPAPPPGSPERGECTTFYFLHTEGGGGHLDAGPMSTDMEEIRAMRDHMMAEGWLLPSFYPGPSYGEEVLPPGSFNRFGIRRVCCKVEGPIPQRWCVYPDGNH
jgi:hypothetical protein